MCIKKYLNSLSCLFSYVVQMETINITYIITTLEKSKSTKSSNVKLVNFFKNVKRKLT
jgi:hypothetical protein